MLKEYRLKHKLTQRQMADMLGINMYSYSRYESHSRKITFEVLIKFLEIRNEENDKIIIDFLKSI